MTREHESRGIAGRSTLTASSVPPTAQVGKRTLTEAIVYDAQPRAPTTTPSAASTRPDTTHQFVEDRASPPVQRSASGLPFLQLKGIADRPASDAAIHAAAERGIATPTTSLPHVDMIQRAFGRHDISSIQAHTGPAAAESAHAMGADAYATGDHVVLGRGTDLHTAAHEAAHVVQQRGGVQLKGGVGEAGDACERHADEVADLVVRGRSAESVLDRMAGGGNTAPGPVQRKISITEGDVMFPDATAALEGLKSELGNANPSGVKVLLDLLDRANKVFPTRKELIELLVAGSVDLSTDIGTDTHAILHRLKGGSFGKFLIDVHGPEVDGPTMTKSYEATDAKYAPEKFSVSKRHTWEGNSQWMVKMIAKFTKVVLTDVPLRETNIMRQTEGKKREFSAYAREIALLLWNHYLPYVADDKRVHMVDVERLDPEVATLINPGKSVDAELAEKIAKNEKVNRANRKAQQFFHHAGLPVERHAEFGESPAKIEDDEKIESKLEDLGQDQTTTSTSNPVPVVAPVRTAVNEDKVVALGQKILLSRPGATRKAWNKAGSLRALWQKALEHEAIPATMSLSEFRSQVLDRLLDVIFATPLVTSPTDPPKVDSNSVV